MPAMIAAAILFSCQEPAPDPVKLAAPVLAVDSTSLSETSFTVTWSAVENAVAYAYVLDNSEEQTVNTTNASFSGLTAGTQYTVKVKSVAAEENGEYLDSEWTAINVTTLSPEEPDEPAVEEIIVDPESLSLYVGETYQLKAEIVPEEAADAVISWSSSNPGTVTVDDNGLVTAIACGEASITAGAGEKTASCTVTVKEKEDIYEIDMSGMTVEEVRTAIQDALAGGDAKIKLIGEFSKTGIPTDASSINPVYDQNPFYGTNVEVIDMTEVTGWPEVDVDAMLDPTTWQPAPDGVYGLPALAFYGLNTAEQTPSYPALREVRLPEEVRAIGTQGFWQCSALETVIAPGAVHIGASAFAYNKNFLNAEFPAADSVYTYAFAYSVIQSVSLPNAHYIDYGAFEDYSQLTSLTLSAEGNIILKFFAMLGYQPFNFETSACDLTINADKHYEDGTASPKAASETQWATDAQNNPLTWKSITFK